MPDADDDYADLSRRDALELRRREEADRARAASAKMNALIRADYRRMARARDGLPPVADRPGPARITTLEDVLRARHQLEADHPGEVIGADRIAKKLAVSRRTVQRRLAGN